MKLDPEVRYFSNSEISTFKRCRRKWWLAYYRWLRPPVEKTTGTRGLGTRLHEALAAWYSPERLDPLQVLEQGILRDQAALMENSDFEGLEELNKDAALARIMIEGYLQWCEDEGMDAGLTVTGAEVEIATPMPGAEIHVEPFKD